MLAIAAAVVGTVGLVSSVRSGQWRNTPTAAFAAAAILMASANLYVSNQIAHIVVDGPGVPKGCIVGSASADHIILSCPVHVAPPQIEN